MEAQIKNVTFYNAHSEIASFYVLAEKDGKFAKFVLKKKLKDAVPIFEHFGKHNFIINKEKKPTESYYKGNTIKLFHVLDIIPIEQVNADNASMEWAPFV
jgi:hypothetical protein